MHLQLRGGSMNSHILFNKCPKCGSTDLEIGVTASLVYHYKDAMIGKRRIVATDAGYTSCNKCGYQETM